MTTDRDIEKNYSLQDFIVELRRLADTLEAGEDYEIEIEDETVLIPGNAVFSIEHEREDGQQEIEFQISWKDEADEDEEDEEQDEQGDDEEEEGEEEEVQA
ncbi:amphi-Trp domain-containing protein [Mesorhizobium sp. J428]|uniref:amphi-Trp domain-containing protein n=1 Tax=Mesorhizobium sp. J428 TaxID=2898440 RepID=UPI00215122CB|nr:amphi-Trp domain-containing protein [Mesorhizobium sp. J428]MCR5858137.1 amphi-Trp domain-containing protein [Mesorhizobium sp. J428]